MAHESPPTNPAGAERASAGLSGDAHALALAWRGDPAALYDLPTFAELIAAPEWHRRAACADRDDLDFFAPLKATAEREAARKCCAACPVLDECRAASIDEEHGIWGGLDEAERRALRKAAATASRGMTAPTHDNRT